MSSNNQLENKVALVTGASGGIGAGCAKRLGKCGMSLALTYSTGKERTIAVMEEIVSSGTPRDKISLHQVDVGLEGDLERLFQEVSASHGHPPDVVVTVAGYAKVIPQIDDISLEEFDLMIAVNLRSTFSITKKSLDWMKQQGWGRMIYVSSIAGEGGGINGCHYAASKAGVNGMMKNLAGKVAKFGITVNCIAPAMIGETGLIPDAKAVIGTPGDVKNIPVGRLGTPEECANVVEMFCNTGYLTGQNIILSGGLK